MGNILEPGIWQCPSCGGSNSIQNAFCVKCGFNPRNPASPRRSGLVWKVAFVFLVLALIAAGAFVGYRQWQKRQAEKAAREYLETQQRFFSDSVAAINGISSETNLDDKYSNEENYSLVEEKMREEKVRAEAAADTVDRVAKSAKGLEANNLVGGLDVLIGSYWQEAYRATGKYQDFMRFKYEEARVNVEIDALWKAYKDRHKTEPESWDEVKGAYVDKKATLDKEIALLEGIQYPEGLAEVYRRGIEDYKKFSQLNQEVVDAIGRKDAKRLDQIFKEGGEMDTADERLTEASEKINDMSNDYFSQMHDEFISLRGKADKIKGEFLMLGTQLKVERLDYSIEGW